MKYLSVAQAAEKLNLTPETIRKYIERGLIQAEKAGFFWLIHEDEIARYERERRPPGRPSKERRLIEQDMEGKG